MEPADRAVDVPAFVVMGTARLPKAVYGQDGGALIVELSLDSADGRVVGVATTVPLPAYAALLRGLLLGRRLEDMDGVLHAIGERLRGPLVKPTMAALVRAVNHAARKASD